MADPATNPEPPLRPDTILVVDDEVFVAALARHILERAGFRVLTADNGISGVAVFADHQEEIIAVLLDLSMPFLGGLQALCEIRKLRPEVPSVLMSGFGEESFPATTPGEGAVVCLAKPFSTQRLLDQLGQVLGRKLELGGAG